jgi:hypothetical protein
MENTRGVDSKFESSSPNNPTTRRNSGRAVEVYRDEHAPIVAAIRRGDADAAEQNVRANWNAAGARFRSSPSHQCASPRSIPRSCRFCCRLAPALSGITKGEQRQITLAVNDLQISCRTSYSPSVA